MITENKANTSGAKNIFIGLIIIFSAFCIYYSIMSMMGPVKKSGEFKKGFESKESEPNKTDERLFTDSAYLKLLKERSFLQSKVAMAKTDSIYLTITLTDSAANLEISGVVVHKAKISRMSISQILLAEDKNTIITLFSSPLNISNTFSSIRKEPLMIKIAPKDTSEYIPDIMPDTSVVEPVNYILEMTNGTRLYVYQEEKEKRTDRMAAFRFDLKYRLRDTWNSLKRVAVLKVPEYHPFIKLKLPREDAKIIYRALPKNGQIAVFR
jgi:hypothetical protein